ncbi:hypothetical protein DUNSADRAFT_5574 [Dunaliella salina]|uniref:Uncharacterized protein n=1 Tax=Dunaliella salina TaxID=3046 RepID=A0ABQ7GQ08_DUNSA|nr:hypothetical protein DUNSADRAFT_5574 [Dunaliella salina]|eukprot:KAF5836699.1 hypothetical protein DUNSADRAFT_5574 [Dunaliella salina]
MPRSCSSKDKENRAEEEAKRECKPSRPSGSNRTSERLRNMMARSGPQRLGSFTGSWRGAISVQCPELGLQGIVVDQQPGPSQAAYSSSDTLLEEINLKSPPPVQLPRLWAVLHSCLLYNDPARASGGKAAQDLSTSLAHYLSALCLDVPNVPNNPGTQKDSEEEEEDDDDMGPSKGLSLGFKRKGKQAAKALKDARSVPPCVKAEHAADKKLHYELQLVLTRS